MNPADISLFVFGIYVIIVGAGFVAMPNSVLTLLKLPETKEPWLRILGGLVVIIGVYDLFVGLYSLRAFEWITVWVRFGFLLFVLLLTVLKQTKPQVILFGVVDAIGAVWTLLALVLKA